MVEGMNINHTPVCVVYIVSLGVVGRDCSVGIATRYWLDGPGIESWWGRDVPHLSRLALGPTQPPVQWVPSLFPGVERPGRGVDHPPLSSAEVKESVEQYLSFLFRHSWPVQGRTYHSGVSFV